MSKTKPQLRDPASAERSLSECAEEALEQYFHDLDGHDTAGLHQLVIAQVERPLLKVALAKYKGNITKTAQALGLNRATLRSRLKKYDLLAPADAANK